MILLAFLRATLPARAIPGPVAAAIIALGVPTPAATADIPGSDAPVSITARNTELSQFLQQLFAQGGFRVQVSNSLRGRRINGQFSGTMSEIWGQVGTAFNLVGYYDRSIVRVYAASDVATRQYDNVDAAALVNEARRLGLTDANNVVTGSGGTVSASGVPAFLQAVGELAGRYRSAGLADGSSPAPGDDLAVISPLVDPSAPGGGQPGVAVPLQVMQPATLRQPYEVRVFFLRYASANDTFVRTGDRQSRVPGVASILAGIMGDGRLPGTVRTSGDDDDRFASLDPVIDLSDEDGLALVPSQNAAAAAPVASAALPRDVNGPRIEVDETQNAVIVRDRPEAMSVYEGIIAALDRAPRMVEIEAAIIDLNIDRLEDLGIEFDISVDGLDVLFGGRSSNPVPDFSSPNLSGSYVDGADSFGARLTALERNGAINVVSRPQLITLDNRSALFDSRQEIYVQVEGTLSRLERIEIGTVLRVTPAIVYDAGVPRVQLRIDIEDGAPTSAAVDGLPVLRRSRVSSQAIINQGESLLLGGITIDTSFEYRSQVPVLGDIPILGQIFRRRREGGSRVERLFLLTPRIVGDDEAPTISRREPIPLEVLQNPSGNLAEQGR